MYSSTQVPGTSYLLSNSGNQSVFFSSNWCHCLVVRESRGWDTTARAPMLLSIMFLYLLSRIGFAFVAPSCRGYRSFAIHQSVVGNKYNDGICILNPESGLPEPDCVDSTIANINFKDYTDDNIDGDNNDYEMILQRMQSVLNAEAAALTDLEEPPEDARETTEEDKLQEKFLSVMHAEELNMLTQPGLGEKPSHLFVQRDPVDGFPVRLEETLFYVDEANCIGCGLCAALAPDTFTMEKERGRGRVYQQGTAPLSLLEEVRSACPTRCIHSVSWTELKDYETRREDRTSETSPLGKPRQVTGSEFPWQSKGSALDSHCYGTKSCPENGCFNCPLYTQPGLNPKYGERQKELLEQRRQRGASFVNGTISYRVDL